MLSAVLVLATILSCAPHRGLPIEDRERARNREAAEAIVDALARYREDHGRYPDDLDGLTPEYLERVPEQVHGVPFGYASDGATYELIYADTDDGGVVTCSYVPGDGWECAGFR